MAVIDKGTLGASPVLVNLNNMLIEINDPKVTAKVCSKFQAAKIEIAKLKKYLSVDVEFYDEMLNRSRRFHLARVDNLQDKIPKIVYTHLRCAVVGEYREVKKEIEERIKENIRRRHKGLKPL